MRVGFIGLGRMGNPMASNLLERGFEVIVFDIDPTAVEEMEKRGATAAKSPKELASMVRTILLSLPYPKTVEEVIAGEEGLLEGVREPSVIIDLSTVTPSTIIHLLPAAEKKGVSLLDAPVSGGAAKAKDGTLTIMVGGDSEVFTSCQPIFDAIATNYYHLGEVGSGSAVKLLNQHLFASNLAAFIEVLLVADEMGIDKEKMVEVLSQSSGHSYALEKRFAPFIAKEKYDPGFSTTLMVKDLLLVSQMAADKKLPLPIGDSCAQLYRLAWQRGFGDRDLSSLYLALKELYQQKTLCD